MSKAPTKLPRNEFLDLEACEDLNRSEEEDDYESDDGFIVQDEVLLNLTEEEIYQDLDIDLDERQKDSVDARIEEFLARAKQRASENMSSSVIVGEELLDVDELSNVKQMVIRSSTPGSIMWDIKVKAGTETRLTSLLTEVYDTLKSRENASLAQRELPLDCDSEGNPISLFKFEAFSVKNLRGHIIISTDDLKRAARRLTPYIADKTVFRHFSRIPVSSDSLEGLGPTLSYLRSQEKPKFRYHQWVRVLRGTFKGDLALVIHPSPSEHPNLPLLGVIPRMDQTEYIMTQMNPPDAAAQSSKRRTVSNRKRKRRAASCLLAPNVYNHMPRKGLWRVYGQRYFLDGLELIPSWPDYLDLHPRILPSEIEPYLSLEVSSRAALEYVRESRRTDWRLGNRAYVFRGELSGAIGTIEEVNSVMRSVKMKFALAGGDQLVDLDWDDVRRSFEVGTWVRVVWGSDKDRTGVVVRENIKKGLVDIWSPREPSEGPNVPRYGMLMPEPVEGAHGRRLLPEEFSAFQDCLTEFEAPPSFAEVRHPYAPGTVTSSFTRYEEGGQSILSPEQEVEESYRTIPKHNIIKPPALPLKKSPLFVFERAKTDIARPDVDRSVLKFPKDPRIGRDACIIATQLKGYWGQIKEIHQGRVTIVLAGRTPPYATVYNDEAVCLDQLDEDMAGFKLKKPLKPPLVTKPKTPPPPRARTPDLIEGPLPNAPTLAELGEMAFLVHPLIKALQVHVFLGFRMSYEGGRWRERYGQTERSRDIVEPTFDLSIGPAVMINWTDDHHGRDIRREVPLLQLRRAPPQKKEQTVVVLQDGSDFGRMGTVKRVIRKDKKAVVEFDRVDHTYLVSDLCRVSSWL